MKFRKLYWTTEQTNECGCSTLTGIFTSIPALTEVGLKWVDGIPHHDGFRVSLFQLDSCGKPLGQWSSPAFEGMKDDLKKFESTDDFNPQDCALLVDNLKSFASR
ncbi:MAG: hypothetical protein ABUL72_03255 [Armatimonadota bacterium]